MTEIEFEKKFRARLRQEFKPVYIFPKFVIPNHRIPDVIFSILGLVFAVELKVGHKEMKTKRAKEQIIYMQKMSILGGVECMMITPEGMNYFFRTLKEKINGYQEETTYEDDIETSFHKIWSGTKGSRTTH